MQRVPLSRKHSALRHFIKIHTVNLEQQWHKEKTIFKECMCILSFREVTPNLLHLEIQTGTLEPVTVWGQWKPDS